LNNNPKIVVFSDLDGTLLNSKYESTETEPIIRRLLRLNVSIVLASSKTRAEIEHYRRKWKIIDPYIAENGSVITLPAGYFKTVPKDSISVQGGSMIELGIPYELVRERLYCVKNQTGAEIVGFGDLTVEEVAEDTGLPLDLAVLAKKREYSEPFKILSGDEGQVLQAIKMAGLSYTKGGRYLTALGCVDKGKAVEVLKGLYLKQFGNIFTFAVGDGENDLTMLAAVDKPFFIRDPSMVKLVWLEIQHIVESGTF
jgi:mannosyl-3-phosphoglycerate phosphatase